MAESYTPERPPATGATRPNIVWVNCDQLRWDAVGYAGNPLVHTPNIDRLAARGVWFQNAYCAAPVCSPARASWLTGLYPHAHRQFINCTGEAVPERHLAAAVPTIGDSPQTARVRLRQRRGMASRHRRDAAARL